MDANDDDEPLAVGSVELADTHPTFMPLPGFLRWLGEVPWTVGTAFFVGFLLSAGVLRLGLLQSAGAWAAVWWATARVCALDHHAATSLARWAATSMRDRRRRVHGGTSVTPFPLRDRTPLGIYPDAA